MPKISKKILLILALLGLILPSTTQALVNCGLSDIGGVVLNFFIRIATGIVGVAAIAFSYLALGLYIIGVSIASWFITIATNVPIVNSWARDVGWTLTRNLVNMTFIIILAWIGIATILRLREYRTGKIFMNLIIIALLVNFSPVLVGVVVDISNIIMNFFLSQITAVQGGQNTFGQFIENVVGERAKEMGQAFTLIYTGNLQVAIQSFMQILGYGLFFFFGSFIFGILALLFFLRVLAFWLLLIVSPIAFICYILPATKKYWNMWWRQLIQWALVGVFASFFLYLSLVFLDAATNPGNPNYLSDTWGVQGGQTLEENLGYSTADNCSFTAVGTTAVTSMLPVMASLVFMLAGVFMAFSGAAAAGRLIERHVPKAIRGPAKRLGKGAVGLGVGAVRGVPAISKAEERARKWLERKPLVGRIVGGPGAFEREKIKKMAAVSKEWGKMPADEIRKAIQTRPITYEDKLKQARLFEILSERKQLTDTERRYFQAARQMGVDVNEVLKRRPDWAADVGKTIEEVISNIEPEDFRKNIQKEALQNPEVTLHFAMDPSKFEEMEKKGSVELRRTIKNVITTNPYFSPATLTPQQWNEILKRAARMSTNPRWQV